MQKVVYKCDQCLKEFGDRRHISLRFAQNSGIATPPTEDGNGASYWHCAPDIRGMFVHFCSPKCVAAWFSNLVKPAKISRNKKK